MLDFTKQTSRISNQSLGIKKGVLLVVKRHKALTIMNLKDQANNPIYVINCFLQGLKLITKAELRRYLLLPIFINLMLYSFAFILGYYYLSDLIAQLIPSWLSWLEWLIYPLFFSGFLIFGFFTFTLLANLIASPFYSQLAAKTLELISEETSHIKAQAVTQVVLAEIKRLGYLMSCILLLLLLSVIPVINLIAPLLWLLFGAWGMALEFMAYPLENQGLLFSQQKEQAKTRRLGALSFGGLVVIACSIPLFNLVVAPAAVIGATIYIHGLEKANKPLAVKG